MCVCVHQSVRSGFTEINPKRNRGVNAQHLAADQGHAEVCNAILARSDFNRYSQQLY